MLGVVLVLGATVVAVLLLARRQPSPFSSYDDLRRQNHAVWRGTSRAQLRAALAAHPVAAGFPAPLREELLLLAAREPFGAAERERAHAILAEALRGFPLRPGTIEEVWHLEGIFEELTASQHRAA